MSNDESAFWVEWPAGMNHVVFADLPHMIALAMWPEVAANSDHRDFAYGGARINLETELPKAVRAGLLKVRDPLTLGPHTFPIGDALKGAVVLLPDLRDFLAESRGGQIGVRVAKAEVRPDSRPNVSPGQRPVQAQIAQEAEILAMLKARGYLPNRLPVAEAGRGGVKSAIRSAIGKTPLFQSNAVFDKAWQRLRDAGRIGDE